MAKRAAAPGDPDGESQCLPEPTPCPGRCQSRGHHDALTAAEADVPDAQRLTPARDAWAGQEQRLQDIQHYLRRDGHGELSPQWRKLAEVAPAILDGFTRSREDFGKPSPLGA